MINKLHILKILITINVDTKKIKIIMLKLKLNIIIKCIRRKMGLCALRVEHSWLTIIYHYTRIVCI